MVDVTAGEQPMCPTLDELHAFEAGTLTDHRLVEIAGHLTTCRRCETIVESLDRDTSSLAAAMSAAHDCQALFREPEFQRLDAFVRALPAFCGGLFADQPANASSEGRTQSIDTAYRAKGVETETQEVVKQSEPGAREEPWPEKIGRYKVKERLGSGSFGHVYLAWDPREQTLVAIKVPKLGELAGEERVQDFLGEARTAAGLQHPGIVQVRDWDRLEDGGCYVVMEYIEGEPLSKISRSERVEPRRAAELTMQIAEALHFAHRKGIYHRDIKPQNILMDEHNRPHVADFGLAISEAERWKHRHEFAGSRPYMAPEQVRCDAHLLDGRTDIYSLGIVLYLLLAGRLPFTGDTEELREEILKRPPPPLRIINETIPAELERICLKCLAKEAVDRYATAQDLADELRAFLGTFGRPKRSSVWFASVAAGCVAATVIAAAVAIVSWGPWSRAGRDEGNRDEIFRRWEDRLGGLPEELIWPGYHGSGKLGFRPELNAYEIMSDQIRMVKLGELAQGNVQLSITMRQQVWIGSTGIFLAYKNKIEDERLVAKFQLISIQERFTSKGRVMRVVRTLSWIVPDSGELATEMELGADEVAIPANGSAKSLQIEIGPEGLISARWDGKELSGISDEYHNQRLHREDYRGPWGLFSQYGQTLYENPTIITVEGGTP
ncbi:MAG: serine/threonine protein kinase [Planctomycetes bacterium]|nr:serine/threonine protein kinase [Planctomycetota bacterium]